MKKPQPEEQETYIVYKIVNLTITVQSGGVVQIVQSGTPPPPPKPPGGQ